MQFKNTDDPRQGSLPPGVAEEPPTTRQQLVATPRGHPRLRHRCPLGCTRTHTTAGHHHHHHHHHPSNTTPQGTSEEHPQPQPRPSEASVVNIPHRQHHNYQARPQHHYYHQQDQHHLHFYHPQQQAVAGNIISRGVSEWRVPPPQPQQPPVTTSISYLPPLDFRRRAIQYMSKRLQVGVNIETQSVREIEKRIFTLEEQVYKSSLSQDEYITKLASRLAAILQHIDKCRSPQAPVTLQTQQERVM